MLRTLLTRVSHLFFFFLMIRRPPRSTLFPTRRSSDLLTDHGTGGRTSNKAAALWARSVRTSLMGFAGCSDQRSEEHTSELQSRLHLVCRLLLEKKKKTNHVTILISST